MNWNWKSRLWKRLNHVLDKSNPRHSNLTTDLEFDLKDLENIDKTIGQQKLRTDTEIKKLSDEKDQLQKDSQAKDALLKQKNEEIGDKLTADLITKLDNLTKGVDENGKVKIDETALTTIKTALEELKTKGAKVDLNETNNGIKAIKDEVAKSKGVDYWSIAACIGVAISTLLLIFLIFKPKVIEKGEG